MVDEAAGDEEGATGSDVVLEARRAVLAWRGEQRAALIAARLALPGPMHRQATRLIRRQLDTYLQQQRPRVLGGYWPIRREFNVLPSLRAQLARGAHVALPVIGAKHQPLQFRLWTPAAAMQRGAYDIPYPADGAVVLPDALLLPMVGFDSGGYRLGYGGGYYDRSAAALTPRPQLIGLALESARLPSIRPLPHDIPMDCIITEHAIRRFDAPAAARGTTTGTSGVSSA